MAKDFTTSIKKLPEVETDVGADGTNAAKSGSGKETGFWTQATSSVDAHGTSEHKKSGNGKETGFWSKATSTVSPDGDNAAKSGKGK